MSTSPVLPERKSLAREQRRRKALAALPVLLSVLASLLAPSAAADASVVAERTGEEVLAEQPRDLVERLFEKRLVMTQERNARADGESDLVTAYVIFNQPRDVVYGLLAQTLRHREFRPELDSIEQIEVLDSGPVDEHRIKILFREIVYRLHYYLDPERLRLAWELDGRFDNDLRRVDGSWALHSLGSHQTLALFGTRVVVGASVPAFLGDMITRRSLPNTMERCRKWVDSNGKYRP